MGHRYGNSSSSKFKKFNPSLFATAAVGWCMKRSISAVWCILSLSRVKLIIRFFRYQLRLTVKTRTVTNDYKTLSAPEFKPANFGVDGTFIANPPKRSFQNSSHKIIRTKLPGS